MSLKKYQRHRKSEKTYRLESDGVLNDGVGARPLWVLSSDIGRGIIKNESNYFSLFSNRLEYFGLQFSMQENAAGIIVKAQWLVIIFLLVISFLGQLVSANIYAKEAVETEDMEVGFMLYGFCLFLMWLRILLFVQVQQELGQFVGVLISMARDLGFFGIVWIILILAFSSAMLGAGIRSSEESQNPMQGWSSWWLLRTYLQSLGQDNIGEMTTHTSNAIFVFMWPMFNILLVNLLVAVMSSRYEKAREDSGVSYCFDLHELYESYTFKTSHHQISLIWNLCKYLFTDSSQVFSSQGESKAKNRFVRSVMNFKTFLNAHTSVRVARTRDSTNKEKDLRKDLESLLSVLKQKIVPPENGISSSKNKDSVLIAPEMKTEVKRSKNESSLLVEAPWIKLFKDVRPDVFNGRLLVLDHYEEASAGSKASWHERLCFIMEGNLCSAPNNPADEPEIICAASDIKAILLRGEGWPKNCFSLSLEEQKSLGLCALDDEDRTRWVNAIFAEAFPQLHIELMQVRKDLSDAIRESEKRASEKRRMQARPPLPPPPVPQYRIRIRINLFLFSVRYEINCQ